MGRDEESSFDSLVRLYGIEAGLVQQKVGHILVIRSLAVSAFSGLIAVRFLSAAQEVTFVFFALLLFYVLEATYDGYLIPIVDREGALRKAISERFEEFGLEDTLRPPYERGLTHRLTPHEWGPLKRGLLEPLRIGFYLVLAFLPFVLLMTLGRV